MQGEASPPSALLFSLPPDSLHLPASLCRSDLASLCRSHLYEQPGCPTCPVAFSDQNGSEPSSPVVGEGRLPKRCPPRPSLGVRLAGGVWAIPGLSFLNQTQLRSQCMHDSV